MDVEDPQPPEPADGEPLDELLAAAKWPEPSAESHQRLQRHWAEISPAGERWSVRRQIARRAARWAVAAAVAAAVAGAAWVTWVRTRTPVTPIVRPTPARTPRATSPQPGPKPDSLATGSSFAPVPVRPANAGESFLVRAAAARDSAAYARRTAQARIERSVESATTARSFDPAREAATLRASVSPDLLAATLSEMARSRDAARRRGAAVLLGELRMRETLPALTELAGGADTRPAVVPALVELAGPGLLADVARRVPDGADRVRLLAALAARDGGEPGAATGLYLQALADPGLSRAALQALEGLPNPPTEPLFAQLRHPDIRMRLASAKALARIDGPGVTARLEVMVRRDVNRREAVAALLYCDSPEAVRFIRTARRSPDLAATINSVAAQARS
jgi:hypothetical protein